METLGERLRKLRQQRNLTQEELAEALHQNRATLASWEIGRSSPDLATLREIADYFGVTLDYLLGRVENPHAAYRSEGFDRVMPDAEVIAEALQDSPELLEFWQQLSRRQELQLMFRQAKDLDADTIKKVVQIMRIIETEEGH